MEDEKKQIALLVRVTTEWEYFHVLADVVYLTAEGKIRNPSSCSYSADLGYADLHVYSQGGMKDEARRLYGFQLCYQNVTTVDTHRAKHMHKMLSAIEKKLEKLAIARGGTSDYADFMGRVAEALGATTILHKRGKTGAGWSYDDADYVHNTIGDGVNYVRWVERMWRERDEETLGKIA